MPASTGVSPPTRTVWLEATMPPWKLHVSPRKADSPLLGPILCLKHTLS